MKQYQKETIKMSLEEEKKVLDSLKKEYTEAKKQVRKKIDDLMSRGDANLPHVIHQVQYQKALESQIDDALSKLKSGEYNTISDYLEESYRTGFTSSLYRFQKQGVPLLFPMNRNEIIRAVQTNSKISGGLYKRLGINTKAMKNAIRQEMTRGISSGMSSADIARNIDNRMNSGLYNSYRIARTEGHRINQEASFDAMSKAKDAGADVVKQWDSTLDGRTRPHHRMLDGQIRELEDPFEVDGLQAQYPSGFGKASEDINCRCVVLEVGRWELDEDETYTKFDGNQGVIVKDLSYAKNYEEFRHKYNIEVKKRDAELKNPPIMIAGRDINVKTEMYGFGDGNGGVFKNENAKVYTLPEGNKFVFPEKQDMSLQTMTPEKAIELWYKVPEELRSKANEVIEFVDYENPLDSHWRQKYKTFTSSYATGGDKITFYKYTIPHDDDYVVRTYCHEIGHQIDEKILSSNVRFSDSFDWRNAMMNDAFDTYRMSCTSYGENDNSEDFAESIAEYVKDVNMNTGNFINVFKERAKILKQILKI